MRSWAWRQCGASRCRTSPPSSSSTTRATISSLRGRPRTNLQPLTRYTAAEPTELRLCEAQRIRRLPSVGYAGAASSSLPPNWSSAPASVSSSSPYSTSRSSRPRRAPSKSASGGASESPTSSASPAASAPSTARRASRVRSRSPLAGERASKGTHRKPTAVPPRRRAVPRATPPSHAAAPAAAGKGAASDARHQAAQWRVQPITRAGATRLVARDERRHACATWDRASDSTSAAGAVQVAGGTRRRRRAVNRGHVGHV